MTLAAGTHLGPYDVIAQIGVGGMGEVYRARDTRLKRDVALKILPESFAADADRLAPFQREAEVLASLNHPHIAAIYGIEDGPAEAGHYVRALVMELVEGPTLAELLEHRAGPTGPAGMPIDEALPIAMQIAEALEAAHEQGIVHRDLKPANIKVRADGTVKVLDFGLAKAMEPARPTGSASMSPTITSPAMMTGVGMILGTAAYMSPEQARGKPVDQRADIWAFGAVLFEMLTGRRAFAGEDVSDTMASVLKTVPDWSALPPSVPGPVRRLLRRCLEKDPRSRLQAIGEARILLGAPVDDEAASITISPRPRFGAGPWVLAGTFLLTTLGMAFLHFREETTAASSVETPTVRLTVQPNQVFGNPGVSEIAISPDGRYLAFTDRSPAGKALWVREMETGLVRLLAGTENAWYPFWSPDSRFVGFYAAGALKRMPVTGGPVQTITEVPDAPVATDRSPAGGRFGWSFGTPDDAGPIAVRSVTCLSAIPARRRARTLFRPRR